MHGKEVTDLDPGALVQEMEHSMGEGLMQEEKSLNRQDTPIPEDDPVLSNEQHPFEQTREVRGWADDSAEISIDEEEDLFTPNQQNPIEEKSSD